MELRRDSTLGPKVDPGDSNVHYGFVFRESSSTEVANVLGMQVRARFRKSWVIPTATRCAHPLAVAQLPCTRKAGGKRDENHRSTDSSLAPLSQNMIATVGALIAGVEVSLFASVSHSDVLDTMVRSRVLNTPPPNPRSLGQHARPPPALLGVPLRLFDGAPRACAARAALFWGSLVNVWTVCIRTDNLEPLPRRTCTGNEAGNSTLLSGCRSTQQQCV